MSRSTSNFPKAHVSFAALGSISAWAGVIAASSGAAPHQAQTHPLTAFLVTAICLTLAFPKSSRPGQRAVRAIFWLATILAVGQMTSHVLWGRGVVSDSITNMFDSVVSVQGATGFDSAILALLFLFGLGVFGRHSFGLLVVSLTALLVMMTSTIGNALSIKYFGDQISVFTFAAFAFIQISILSILSRKLPLRVLFSDSRPGREVRVLLGGTVVAAIILVPSTIAVAELRMINDQNLAIVFTALISIAIFNMLQVLVLGSRGLIAEAKERRMRRHIEYERDHDYLTGLMTRRAGQKKAVASLLEQKKRKNSLGVLIYDLDDFKAVNDAFGHDAGDKALQDFSRELRRTSNKDDILIRWGGDEFVVICPVDDPVAFMDKHREEDRHRGTAAALGEAGSTRYATPHTVGASIVFENETDLRPAILRADASLIRHKLSLEPKSKARMNPSSFTQLSLN